MTYFSDIHTHILWGLDDGAKTEEDSKQLLESAYADGSRIIALTPHYHPGYFHNDNRKTEANFRMLSDYAKEKYPSLKLFLGNEIRYSPSCVEWLKNGACLTMNGTSNVLVDFSENEERSVIVNAARQLLNAGYRPVIAHVERYKNLNRNLAEIHQMKYNGAVIQIDASSLFGDWGFFSMQRSRKLIERRLVDLVCSDAHNMIDRKPGLTRAYQYVLRRCGQEYADNTFCHNASSLLEE